MRSTGARFWLAGAVCGAVLLAGCTDDRATKGDPPSPTAQPTLEAADATAAGRLRLRLERQFAVLVHRGLEAARAGKADREAAEEAVADGIDELGTTVGAAYDRATSEEFESGLAAWVDRIADHAGADEGERADTRKAALTAGEELAALMARVTDGGMESEGTAALLREPTRAATTSAEAFTDRDFDRAYLHHRAAFADMVSVGQAFGAGIAEQFPDRYAGPRSSGPLELHAALQQLAVEHALLTGVVNRRGATAARDFDAAAAALNGNTEDLVTALDAVYGATTSQFAGAWRDRISLLADYTVAVAEGRPQRQRRSSAGLDRADKRLGGLVADLTEETISAGEVTAGLARLTASLRDHIDAYVAKERSAAEVGLTRAVAAAGEFAALLAEAVVAHRPEEFLSQ